MIRNEYTEQNNYYLGPLPHNGNPFISARPIVTLDDFTGMVIRTHGTMAAFFEEMGASTMWIPGSEIYTGLQLGTMDAATWGGEGTYYGWKWYEVAKYISKLRPHGSHGEHLTANLDAWNELPDDLKAICETAIRRWGFRGYSYTRTDDGEKLKTMIEEHGVTHQDISPEAWEEAPRAGARCLDIYAAKDAKSAEFASMIDAYMKFKGYW